MPLNGSKLKTIILAATATIMAVSLMIFPKEALDASINGLTMWWEVVFPSLLPFFIVSEFLIGFGVVSFLGCLLEPLMRPLFRVPGVGGFVWAMGIASGYPAGAKLTARLRQENKLTADEAERLVTFTNSSNPLFIFGAIAVGFFHNPALGIVLALSHYLGNFCVGLLMRFHGQNSKSTINKSKKSNKSLFKEAFNQLHQDRLNDGRPIGKILGDAVHSSVTTLLMIGGFIILFSVLNRLLSVLEVATVLSNVVTILLSVLQIPKELSLPIISGLFEITLGSQMASKTAVSLYHQVIVTSFILAFSGFSVQAQVASILAETDIRFKPYFIARLFHGVFAALFTIILWKPLYVNQQMIEKNTNAVPVFFQKETYSFLFKGWDLILKYGSFFTLIFLCIYIILTFSKVPQKKSR